MVANRSLPFARIGPLQDEPPADSEIGNDTAILYVTGGVLAARANINGEYMDLSIGGGGRFQRAHSSAS